MDLEKFLQALEEFVYEIALWPVMIPKTWFHFLLRPARIHAYVTKELEKPVERRWREFMSPVIFWAVAAVAPFCVIIEAIYRSLHSRAPGPGLRFRFDYSGVPLDFRMAGIVIFLLSGPLSFAFTTLLCRRQAITRDTLRRPLYVQLLALTPFYLVYLIVFVLTYLSLGRSVTGLTLPWHWITSVLNPLLFLSLVISALFTESRLLEIETSWNRKQALMVTALAAFGAMMMFAVMEILDIVFLLDMSSASK